jgi:hypothetical protein
VRRGEVADRGAVCLIHDHGVIVELSEHVATAVGPSRTLCDLRLEVERRHRRSIVYILRYDKQDREARRR